jgi:hypothetical protein
MIVQYLAGSSSRGGGVGSTWNSKRTSSKLSQARLWWAESLNRTPFQSFSEKFCRSTTWESERRQMMWQSMGTPSLPPLPRILLREPRTAIREPKPNDYHVVPNDLHVTRWSSNQLPPRNSTIELSFHNPILKHNRCSYLFHSSPALSSSFF